MFNSPDPPNHSTAKLFSFWDLLIRNLEELFLKQDTLHSERKQHIFFLFIPIF